MKNSFRIGTLALLTGMLSCQLLFSTSDFIARWHFKSEGYNVLAFASVWFVIYVVIRWIAEILQIWVVSQHRLGIAMSLLAGMGIILSTISGCLFLGEELGFKQITAIVLVLMAYAVALVKKKKGDTDE